MSTHNNKQINPVAIEYVSSCLLPTQWATFQLHAFLEPQTGKEHLALSLGDVGNGLPVLARLHSECLTGDALFSLRCDCGAQLEAAMKKIGEQGRGIILYLRQEGRGIGLLNKVLAYRLQDGGADTVEANQALGFEPDQRDYQICEPMLQHFHIKAVQLMSNNPRKAAALTQYGIDVVAHIPLIIQKNPHNERYLLTKATKLGHKF